MPWAPDWKAALSDAQLEPILLADVGTFAWSDSDVWTVTFAGETFGSQSWVPGIEAGLLNQTHEIADMRTSGQSVKIRDWTTTTGSFSFALTSTKPGTATLPFSPVRGMHVQMRMGFAGGYSSLGFEVIARGMIDKISRNGDTWWVHCRDTLDVLRTKRVSPDDPDFTPVQYFESVGKSTEITSGHAWASGGGNDLYVDDLSIFEKSARSGAVGVAKVEGGGGRDAWWFVYSAKSAASGAGTLTASGSSDWFGNLVGGGTYPVGTVVTHYGVVAGKPWNVYARLMRSTGAESSSGFDTLPSEWGCGLPLWMIDTDDILAMGSHPSMYDRSTGSDITPKWTPFFLTAVDDMLRVVTEGLAQLNMWPVVLEDQLSIRLAYDYRYFDPLIVDWIDDDWIVSIDSFELFHPDAAVQFLRVGGAYTHTGDLYSLRGDDPDSRPWLEKYEKTIGANGRTVGGTAGTPDTKTCWEAGVATGAHADSRTQSVNAHTWYTKIPEALTITTRTLRYAPLVPGDLVSVTSRHILGRDGLYDEETLMVTSVTPDWLRGQVTLDLARLPRRNS